MPKLRWWWTALICCTVVLVVEDARERVVPNVCHLDPGAFVADCDVTWWFWVTLGLWWGLILYRALGDLWD